MRIGLYGEELRRCRVGMDRYAQMSGLFRDGSLVSDSSLPD